MFSLLRNLFGESTRRPCTRVVSSTALPLLLLALLAGVANGTPGEVLSHQKISETVGGFTGWIENNEELGISAGLLGDLDDDGVDDVIMGSVGDGPYGPNCGRVWILFLNSDGTVKSNVSIGKNSGGLTGTLDSGDAFGCSVAPLGDLDGDGVEDVAVGARQDDDGGSNRGAVWIILLNADGSVKSDHKISDTDGGFTGTLDDSDYFGGDVAVLGDLDGDGVDDLCVGATGDDDGGNRRGALWVLLLNSDGTVKSHQKISDTDGGFTGVLDDVDTFGGAVCPLGDLDVDGVEDVAVGASNDDDGGNGRGAVWILFLNTDGTERPLTIWMATASRSSLWGLSTTMTEEPTTGQCGCSS